MRQLTTSKLILKRITDDWKLLLSIFVGMIVASSLLAGAPVYIRTLERQSIDTAIERADQPFLNLFVFGSRLPLSRDSLNSTGAAVDSSLEGKLSDISRGHDRYLKTSTFLVGTPRNPLSPEPGALVSRGYFRQISRLNDHVTWPSGRMASDDVTLGPNGPRMEGVISTFTASAFDIGPGDQLVFTSSMPDPTRITVDIVGILDPIDKTEEFWQQSPNSFLAPLPLNEPPDPGVRIDREDPPVAVFTSYEGMIAGVGAAYPGILINSDWYVLVDKQGLKGWSEQKVRDRLDGFESDVANSMQGTAVLTGIDKLLDDLERRSFFSGVPLLLLLVVMVITVLYYVSMLISYLTLSREYDVALLRSRGVTTWHLVRLYAFEGLVLAFTASVIAPFLAMSAVAAAGKLGYFGEITGGATLPVAFHWMPFAVAAATGVLSLAMYVVPAVIGARTGLAAHNLRSSRPPSVPFFQKFYLDIGLLVVGGLVFWELHSRGQVVSGGLFSDVQVNEALLFAPVLALTVVALLFTRFFPMFVRFFSGDSLALVHLLAAASLATLGLDIASQEASVGGSLDWIWEVSLIGAIGVAYYWTSRRMRALSRTVGMLAQVGLIALLLYIDAPASDEFRYVPTIVVALLVPLQVTFIVLRRLNRTFPVWASMAIWHMARNPLQYSWLVLLLVMVTGLGVLATTVGGTLDRSHEERIFFEVGSDLRVTGTRSSPVAFNERLTGFFSEIPGVTSVSRAYRGDGNVGSAYAGNDFSLLAVEAAKFPYISWYRDDFSSRPLTGIMRSLQSGVSPKSINIPEGAQILKVWVDAEEFYPNMFIRIVVQDNKGSQKTTPLGRMQAPGWTLMDADIPNGLEWPVSLVSVQIFEPVFGPFGQAGTLRLDDIHVEFDDGREPQILDDFEGANEWVPLATSMISKDSVGVTKQAPHDGRQAGIFTFGVDTDQGVRGFYRSPSGGPVPAVASDSFLKTNGVETGDAIIVNISGRILPVRIMDTVNYFPTMDPTPNGFLLVDLDNALRYLNSITAITKVWPNELFISENPGSEEEVRRQAMRLAPARQMVQDRASLVESVRLDPLITAGWKAMALLAVGVILFVASLGYVTYLLSFSDQNRNEMGFLQVLGLSKRQMGWLLSAEHLAIAALGLIIGTAAGFAMSNMMVSALAVTENGEPVTPPLILTTNWGIMGPIYIALAVIFTGALIWLTRATSNIELHELSRVDGE
ncbi:MAG: ABC transporter permease [SAR202 cluster bacterium]|jgi:hypothetical protein|nr:ABC transporter permease [SAR202 cluster bacterium]MDP6714214.1 ABC transporter permease [SAR202 cluster bacterium]